MASKPPELVEPDPRWQVVLGDRPGIEQLVDRWEVSDTVPQEIAELLDIARKLLVHSYFVYEFSTVAVIWSLLAVESALRERVGTGKRMTFADLIAEAKDRGLFSDHEAEAVQAGRQLRNRIVHQESNPVFPFGAASNMVESAHHAVSDLYDRSPT